MLDKNLTYIVQNTCGFDSLVHIFANATMYEAFNSILKTESTEIFSFIKEYIEEGPTKKIYKKRAELLKKVEFFIRNGATSDIIIIDALSNINNLCEQIFNKNPSYTIKNICNKCKNNKSRAGIILPIQTKVIEEYGYEKLDEAITEYVTEVFKNKNCKSCNKKLRTEIEYGSHIFIEHTISQQSYNLNSFADYLILNDYEYKLTGIVNFYDGSSINTAGHYTALIKCNENWTQFDDLSRKPSKITNDITINPHLLVYIKV